MQDDATLAEDASHSDSHRGRAAYLYGLIITGAVLATASAEFRLVKVVILLLGTLVIYWAAETYAHWIAARGLLHRPLTRSEQRQIVLEGSPLVTACAVPVVFLAVEWLVGIETGLALDLALALNTGLLLLVGWRMGKDGGLDGARLAVSVVATGALGAALIVLKSLMH